MLARNRLGPGQPPLGFDPFRRMRQRRVRGRGVAGPPESHLDLTRGGGLPHLPGPDDDLEQWRPSFDRGLDLADHGALESHAGILSHTRSLSKITQWFSTRSEERRGREE